MRPILKYVLPIALSLAAMPAHALTPLGWSWETYVTLTSGDIDAIKTTLATQVHGRQPGTVATWQNPQSGNSGSITLLNISSRERRRCELIEYRLVPPNRTPSDRFVLTSCVQPDGTWKLSE